jgi:hypothetical protein
MIPSEAAQSRSPAQNLSVSIAESLCGDPYNDPDAIMQAYTQLDEDYQAASESLREKKAQLWFLLGFLLCLLTVCLLPLSVVLVRRRKSRLEETLRKQHRDLYLVGSLADEREQSDLPRKIDHRSEFELSGSRAGEEFSQAIVNPRVVSKNLSL